MGSYVNYWKVKNNVINHKNSNYIYSYIGDFSFKEIKDKAKKLYEEYAPEWEGILLRIIRTNAWDEPKNMYYLYFNGSKFIKDPDFIYFDNSDIIEHLK